MRLTRQFIRRSVFGHSTHIWELHYIEIKRRGFKTANRLRIPKAIWQKVSADKETRDQQRKKAAEVLKKDNGPPQLNCWKPPIRSKIVSLFASPRYLPNGRGYYHSGVDLRGWTGTPIRSPADGKVVLAEFMIVPGNNVILSHGGSIYSRYMHMDKMRVKVGDTVKQGQILGTTGATGRVEAPHLHWEVRWKGHHADPHQFMTVWNQYCSRQ